MLTLYVALQGSEGYRALFSVFDGFNAGAAEAPESFAVATSNRSAHNRSGKSAQFAAGTFKAEPGVNDDMTKLAHAVVEEPTSDKLQDDERLYLKKKKEEEIRMKLDAFARELSEMRDKRKQQKNH